MRFEGDGGTQRGCGWNQQEQVDLRLALLRLGLSKIRQITSKVFNNLDIPPPFFFFPVAAASNVEPKRCLSCRQTYTRYLERHYR
jgi:hypothetical protein